MPTSQTAWSDHVRKLGSNCGQMVVRGWRAVLGWSQLQATESRKCSQCGHAVELLASVCPRCGGSSPARISPLACAAVLGAGVIVVSFVLWLF